MKQQLLFASKFLALTGLYLFTRSRTPTNKLTYPEKSIAVLFLLENLKRVFLYNARLIKDSNNDVELLESDIRLLKAFLKDCSKRPNKDDEGLEELVAEIQNVVVEAEDVIVAFANQAAENSARNFFQRAFGGTVKLIGVAKEVRGVRAKVKNVYAKSMDVFYHRRGAQRGGA